jgi:hypothetical protein
VLVVPVVKVGPRSDAEARELFPEPQGLHDADWLGQNSREPSKYVLELLAFRPEQRADQDLQPPSDVLRPILSEPYIDCSVGCLSS